MKALLLALVLAQGSRPVASLIVPQSSLAKLDGTAFRNILLHLDKPPSGDTLVISYDVNGVAHTASGTEASTAREAIDQVAIDKIAPQADLYAVADLQQLVGQVMPRADADWPRAMQRLGLDKLTVAVGGAKLAGKTSMHLDGLVPYPPPRAGFVEALGPPAPAVIPASVPQDAHVVAMVSVRPSAVFNQANLALSAASPVDQAVFITHLRGLENQMGKRFADEALGSLPRIWSFYYRGQEQIAVLEVADAALVKAFLERYADALQVLAPGSKAEHSKIGKRDAIALTVPGRGTTAVAFDSGSLVIGPSFKALTAHFAAKGRKPVTLAPAAVAWASATTHTAQATHVVTLTNEGFRITSDGKVR